MKAVEPTILEQAWYYDKGVSAFMGGPGRKGFDAIAVRRQGGRRRRERRRPTRQRHRRTGAPRVATSGSARRRPRVGIVLLLVWFVVIRGIL
ncbi:MAG: hypothetical protein R2713_20950 [Ilumatobacteraceae bacterium]